ncbi:conserved exported protein of unknown function [Streptomyces sp. KY75]|nr:conserved exported protein of unknown function [Streptomyces sp. KY75]CAD5990125.1 conserved exported protein of unknown function [Streptomyces sp. KY70]
MYAVLVLLVTVTATAVFVRVLASPTDDHAAIAGTSGSEAHSPLSGVYAYTTQKEFLLVRGEQPPVRVPRVFDLADSANNDVVWTHDGLWAALLSDAALFDQPEDVQLITVNAKTGEVERRPCPRCNELAAVGAHDLVTLRWDKEAQLTRAVRYDASSHEDRGTQIAPASDSGGTWQISLLGGTRTHLLTGSYEMSGGFKPGMELRLTDLTPEAGAGTTTSYRRFDSNAYMPTALTTIDGQERIAVGVRKNPGECAASFPVALLSPTGEVQGTDQSAALPPGYVPGVTGGIEVHDLWWGIDEYLYATMSSWTCSDSAESQMDKMRLDRPPSLWRLDGSRWVAAGSQPVTVARQLGQDTTMVLTVPDCIGPSDVADPVTYCHLGTLFRERQGRRTEVAERVLGLHAPSPIK